MIRTYFCLALQTIAAKCNWGTHYDQALRDQFIRGVFSNSLKRKLTKENFATYDLAKTRAFEEEQLDNDFQKLVRSAPPIYHVTAQHQKSQFSRNAGNARNFQNRQPERHQVQHYTNHGNRLQQSLHSNNNGRQLGLPSSTRQATDYQKTYVRKSETAQGNCWRCGQRDHSPQDCYLRRRECFKCHKLGHAASQCWSVHLLIAEFSGLDVDSLEDPEGATAAGSSGGEQREAPQDQFAPLDQFTPLDQFSMNRLTTDEEDDVLVDQLLQ